MRVDVYINGKYGLKINPEQHTKKIYGHYSNVGGRHIFKERGLIKYDVPKEAKRLK